jgi:hypothetical protein
MKRTNADGHSNNQFVDGDPSQGVKGTTVDATWLNLVQEEICSIIEGFGVALDDQQNDQIYQILVSKFASASWKGVVAEYADLPGADNTLGDCRLVTSDADPANNIIWWWDGDSWEHVFTPADTSAYLPLAGGTMTGGLVLDTGAGGLTNWLDALIASGEAYDSGWFAVTKDTTYVKTHGLGAAPRLVKLYLSVSANPSDYAESVFYMQQSIQSGMRVITITGTQLTIHTAVHYIDDQTGSAGYGANLTSGYARVVAFK